MDKRARILKAAELLEGEYGSVRWAHESHKPLDTLIGTILSQNTSDKNSIPAFKSLKQKFPSWQKLQHADERTVASAIRKGGLANIKARRIKAVLGQIKQRTGSLSLDFLAKMPKEKAREWLLGLEGVGPKTAAVTLIFGFGMPVFPVDTHIFRVSRRLGLVGNKESYESAHETLGRLVPGRKKASLHINLIMLGRQICHPRKPECGKCPVRRICPSAFKIAQ